MSLEVEKERVYASGGRKINDESLSLYPRHVASNVCWKLVSLCRKRNNSPEYKRETWARLSPES